MWCAGRSGIRWWAPAAVLCLLAGAWPGAASQTYPGPPSVAELSRRADAVVIGEVLSVAGVWDAAGRTIHTRVELAVAETLKGGEASRLTFIQVGGRVGDRISTVAGAATFEGGERVLVFLERAPDGSLRLTDPLHGKFRIERDAATGRDDLVRVTGAPKVDRTPLEQARVEVRRALGGSGS